MKCFHIEQKISESEKQSDFACHFYEFNKFIENKRSK